MGVRLIREVLEHAPADLTSAERLVLIVLAEDARDETRECWPSLQLLQQRAGLKARTLGDAVARLAGRGLEVRKPVGTDKHGRPMFAFKGRSVTYRVPDLEPKGHALPLPLGDQWSRSDVSIDPPKVTPDRVNGHVSMPPSERERSRSNVTPPVSPSEVPSDAREPERDEVADALCREHGWPVDHCREVTARILDRATQPVRFPRSYVLGAVRKDVHKFAPGPKPKSSARRCTNGALVAGDGSCCPDHETERGWGDLEEVSGL